MKNLGPKSREWLASVNIHTWDDVANLGVVETYKRVKAAFPDRVTPNMLYGLQAGLLEIPWTELPQDIKDELKRQVEES